MTFREVLSQVIEWLQQDKRVSYRAMKRQFHLDDEYLADLKDELIEVQRVAVDHDGTMLVWTGGVPTPPADFPLPQPPLQPVTQADQPTQAESPPLAPPSPDSRTRGS